MFANKVTSRLKQAKGNESIQIKRERFHDSETLKKQAGKTQYTIDAITGCGKVYDKYAFVHNRGLATKPARNVIRLGGNFGGGAASARKEWADESLLLGPFFSSAGS